MYKCYNLLMPGFAFNPDPSRTQVWSCGGGTQSIAIAGLIVRGCLPKPEVAVIIDTEREKSSTWEYYDSILRPQLALVGIDLVRLQKSRYATVDLWRNDDILLPVYTNRNGAGKLPAYCSGAFSRLLASFPGRKLTCLGAAILNPHWLSELAAYVSASSSC